MIAGTNRFGIAANDRVNILGVGVSPLNLSRAVSSILSFLATGKTGYICVTDMHAIMEAQADPEFRDIQNNSFLTTPDGMPTVWIGRLDGHDNMRQVRGADLMLKVCESSVRTGTRHFLYGGKPGVAELLRDILTLRFPGIKIVGTYTPPFRPLTQQEEVELQCQLAEAKVDILWCGIGCPKQERFMAKYLRFLPVRLMIGVGAAFDLNAGLLSDSPQWLRKCGLQWAHRLWQEPRRLWRRYLLDIPRFLWLYLLQWTGIRSYDLSRCTPDYFPLGAVAEIPAGEGSTDKSPGSFGDVAA